MLIAGQHPFFVCQVRQKSEPSGAIGGYSVMVNDKSPVEELAEIIPIEVSAVLELLHQPRRIECIVRLPEFQHDEAADEWLVERFSGEHAEVVDVARLVPLITARIFSATISVSARQMISAGAKGNDLK